MQGHFLKRTKLKIAINVAKKKYCSCVILSLVTIGLIILGAINNSYGLIDVAKCRGCDIVRSTVVAVKWRDRQLWLCYLVLEITNMEWVL
jgi:hypothetical protein